MNANSSSKNRYKSALSSIPSPGKGCHPALLSVANHGIRAGVTPDELVDDIRDAIPPGARKIPDREIVDAVGKALSDHKGGSFTPKPKPQPVVPDAKVALQRIIESATIREEQTLMESSPVRLRTKADDPHDYKALFENLYRPDDYLFIGDHTEPGVIGRTIRPALDWLNALWNGEPAGPFIIPNVLTGKSAKRKDGKETLRGDGNVKEFRFAVVEFDDIPREDQIAFWSVAKLPVAALIDSGGKSIHAWLNVHQLASVASLDDWDSVIKGRLYQRMLVPLGVDPACSNPARLSRLPGHYRAEKERYQRVLWLAGRAA